MDATCVRRSRIVSSREPFAGQNTYAADSGCSNSGSLVKRYVPAERRRSGLPKIDQSRLSGEKMGGGSIVSSNQ